MQQEVTEYGYVVISPRAGHIITTLDAGGQAHQVMYFKVGKQASWASEEKSYKRCNPDFWFKSFKVHWEGDPTGAAGDLLVDPNADGDLFGKDGPKQILARMFASPRQGAGQTRYSRLYPNKNTEWWYTIDANAINALRNLQQNWDGQWALNAPQTIINNGTVGLARDATGTALGGPDFTRRFGVVEWLRDQIGIPSQDL